jgi:hypothetical protein
MADNEQGAEVQQWLTPESANWLKRHWDLHGPVEWQADLIAGPTGTPQDEAQENVNNMMRGVTGHLMPEAVREELRRRGLTVPPPTGDWPSRPPTP